MEHMTFTTHDGMEIQGLYRSPEHAKAAVLLLHMMPATKESWDDFSAGLEKEGIASLAIDLRGHGESTIQGGVKIDYREFTDEEHQATRFDVEASSEWLMEKTGMDKSKIAVVGASIGANLAARYALEHPECPAAVLLSPGLDYHGVMTEDAIRGLSEKTAVLIAVSDEDTTSALSVKTLETLETKAERTVLHLQGKGHGTSLYENDPDFMAEVLKWLSQKV